MTQLINLGIKPLNGKFRIGENTTVCPKCSSRPHATTNPSLRVKLEPDGSAVWHCHYSPCGYKGATNQKFSEVTPQTDSSKSLEVVNYLKSRGISEQTCVEYGIFPANPYFPAVNLYKTAVGFPYYDQAGQRILAAKYRSLDKDFTAEPNGASILFGMHLCKGGPILYIVEGEIDCMTLYEAGIKDVVSVPNSGTERMEWIKNCEHFIDGYSNYVFCGDTDTVGNKLRNVVMERLGKEKCAFIEWPEGFKDANSFYTVHGVGPTLEKLQNAVYPPIDGLTEASDYFGQVDSFYANGHQRGLKIGFKAMSDFYTVRKGELTILTGYPSMGKSDFMDQVAVNMSMFYEWKWCMASFENERAEHISKLIEKYTSRSFFFFPKIKDYELQKGKIWIQEHFSFIESDEVNLPNIDWILDRAATCHKRKGIDGFVLDPWNYVNQERHGESETDHTAKLLIRLRNFARHRNVAVFLIAHPAKPYRNKDGTFPVPTMHDISGSRNFFAVTDNGLVVHRDINNPGESEIHVQKVRSRATGKAGGIVKLKYDWPTGTYYEEAIAEKQDLTSDDKSGIIFE